MSASPLVSIIIRTRDRPLGLREALESVAAQTYPNLEVVAVNDGGQPVRAILEEVLGPTPRAWTLIEWPDNRGRGRAGNAGLLAARGDYLGFLDDDDVLYPEHLAILMAHFAANPADRVAYTDAFQANQVPDPSAPYGYRTVSHELVLSWDVNPEQFRERNWIPIHCPLFRRECLAEAGGFDEGLRLLEDWDFWLRLSWRFPMTHLKRVTGEYRYRSDHPRTADPMAYGSKAEVQEAIARIKAKVPERDAAAPLTGWQAELLCEREALRRAWQSRAAEVVRVLQRWRRWWAPDGSRRHRFARRVIQLFLDTFA